MIKCYICKKIICKYQKDVGDTVCINLNDSISKNTLIYICDDCSHNIALQRIGR